MHAPRPCTIMLGWCIRDKSCTSSLMVQAKRRCTSRVDGAGVMALYINFKRCKRQGLVPQVAMVQASRPCTPKNGCCRRQTFVVNVRPNQDCTPFPPTSVQRDQAVTEWGGSLERKFADLPLSWNNGGSIRVGGLMTSSVSTKPTRLTRLQPLTSDIYEAYRRYILA